MAADPGLLWMSACRCACHQVEIGDFLELCQHANYAAEMPSNLGVLAVDRRRALDAAVACAVCRDHHVAALSGRPPELDPPRRTSALAVAVFQHARDTTFTPPTQWSGDGPED
jgi:hypothetical protein